MSTKRLSLVLGVLVALIAAGAGTYYVLAVLPQRQAAARSYTKHLEDGREALEVANDGSRAIIELKEASKIYPDRIEPRLLIARAYFKLQRFQEAIAALDAAETSPQTADEEARLDLERGRSFVARFVETQNRRDMVEAKTSLEKAASHDATKAEALFNLGTMYMARKTTADRDKALSYWADALKIDQDSETAKRIKPVYDGLLQLKSEGAQEPPAAGGEEH